MKKLQLTLILTTLFFTNLFSSDHIVDVTGVGGAHTTISSAIAASVAGDRLLIYPNVTPFSENVTINHSLELTTAIEGERFKLTGNITINSVGTLPANSEITIANALLLNGNIATGYNTAAESVVNIVGCKILYGYISFNTNGFSMNIANDSIMHGYVYLKNGYVLGNYIDVQTQPASGIYVGSDTSNPSEDHIYISGNHIKCGSGSYISVQKHGIYWTSTQKYAHISNNLIERTVGSAYQSGIYYTANKTGAGENRIENNTITGAGTNSWSMYIAAANSVNKVHNNLVVGSSMDYGIETISSLNNQVSYNFVEATITAFGASFTNDGTNVSSTSNIIDADGLLTAGDAINGGNPDAAFTDLDLSTNDAGCYGGSLSKANFDAMTGITGAKTFFLKAPRRVITGETIDIFGIGFDH